MQRKRRMNGIKSLLRFGEGLLEILILTVLYYVFFRTGYDVSPFPEYARYGKYVLCGIYALLMMVLFFGMDGYKFGYLKNGDVLVSQILSLVIANFITYWQLCLIANRVIAPVPVLLLTVADVLVALICTPFYAFVYHRLYVPKEMVMIIGRNEAVELKFKMETRPDKYHIAKLIWADMPQKSYAFRMSALRNLCLGGGEKEKAMEMLRSLGIEQLAKAPAKKLSGGETARMALGRMLMESHELIILDEPTASMDMESTALSEELIRAYCRREGCAAVWVTHSLAQARRVADKVLFLKNGLAAEWGEAAQVLESPRCAETAEFLKFYE